MGMTLQSINLAKYSCTTVIYSKQTFYYYQHDIYNGPYLPNLTKHLSVNDKFMPKKTKESKQNKTTVKQSLQGNVDWQFCQ